MLQKMAGKLSGYQRVQVRRTTRLCNLLSTPPTYRHRPLLNLSKPTFKMDKGPGKRPRRSSPGTPSATPAQKRFKPSSVDWSGSADLEALLLEQKQNSSAKVSIVSRTHGDRRIMHILTSWTGTTFATHSFVLFYSHIF